jgi:hypothetical protein
LKLKGTGGSLNPLKSPSAHVIGRLLDGNLLGASRSIGASHRMPILAKSRARRERFVYRPAIFSPFLPDGLHCNFQIARVSYKVVPIFSHSMAVPIASDRRRLSMGLHRPEMGPGLDSAADATLTEAPGTGCNLQIRTGKSAALRSSEPASWSSFM